jgi:hypothetical protein
MIYFGYPLDIHGWKTKPETEPNRFRGPKPKNRKREIIPEPKSIRPVTRGYPIRNRPAAILNATAAPPNIPFTSSINGNLNFFKQVL